MQRIVIIAVGLLAAASFIPTSASAEVPQASTNPEYLGQGFAIDSNGYHGKQGLLQDAAADQTTCAVTAVALIPAGSGYSVAAANALAVAEPGSMLHQACVQAVATGLENTRVVKTPVSKTQLWKRAQRQSQRASDGSRTLQRNRGAECTPRYCVFRVEGRDKEGRHKWRQIKVRRGQSVVVFSVKRSVQVQGEWQPVGAPFGIGLGGCVNRLAQTFERVTTLKFKLRFSYGKPGKPEVKPDTPGPSGDGTTLPPAEPPVTPPDNGETGPTTPPPGIEPGDGTSTGGCTDSWGNPRPCG